MNKLIINLSIEDKIKQFLPKDKVLFDVQTLFYFKRIILVNF